MVIQPPHRGTSTLQIFVGRFGPNSHASVADRLILGNDCLVIFGGRSLRQKDKRKKEPFDMNDVNIFHIPTQCWHTKPQPIPNSPEEVSSPRPRHAPISAISGNRLFIFGGQDTHDKWFDDAHVYNLSARRWTGQHKFSTHVGKYRSTAATTPLVVEISEIDEDEDVSASETSWSRKLVHLPYTNSSSNDEIPAVFFFSNDSIVSAIPCIRS